MATGTTTIATALFSTFAKLTSMSRKKRQMAMKSGLFKATAKLAGRNLVALALKYSARKLTIQIIKYSRLLKKQKLDVDRLI